MDILKKYAKKKTIFLAAFIYSSIYAVLCFLGKVMGGSFNTSSSDFSALESMIAALSSLVTIIQILFYVMLVVAIVIAVLAAVYYFKKDKKDYVMLGEFIGYGLAGALLLFSVPGFNAACKVIRIFTSGDYSSLYSMDSANMMSSIQTAGSCLKAFNWVVLIVFVLNLFVFLVIKKVIKISSFSYSLVESAVTGERKIVSYDPQTGEPIYEDVPVSSTVQAGETMAGVKAFFKTKNGKITLGVIAAAVVLFGGYKVYDTYFNKTAISLLDNVQVEFTGYDGAGRVSTCRMGDVEYDKTNAEIASFVNTITLSYDTDTDLKNGDEIKVTATYNQTTAENLKLDVKNATKTVKVKGLTERYKKASEVSNKFASAIKKSMDEEMKSDYDDRSSTYTTYKTSFVSMYYAYDEETTSYPNDYCIGIYKVDYAYNYGSTSKTETYYAMAYVNGVNSSYSTEDKKTIYTSNIYGSGYQRVTDEAQIESALESNYRFDDHKLTKFK